MSVLIKPREEQPVSNVSNINDKERYAELAVQLPQRLLKLTHEGGDDNRLVIQGDRGYLAARGSLDESTLQIILAAGRSLEKALNQEEAQRLHDLGFRRKSAAHPFTRDSTPTDHASRETLTHELLEIAQELYISDWSDVALFERQGDRPQLNNKKLIDAMRLLSKQRDMSARQKVYWAVIRAEMLLALEAPPPPSLTQERGRSQWVEAGLSKVSEISSSVKLHDFRAITGYRSAAIFSDAEALEGVDPRGTHWVRLPGRLAISLALEQGWDSLLINPHGAIGGELYRNELVSILEGLERMGW